MDQAAVELMSVLDAKMAAEDVNNDNSESDMENGAISDEEIMNFSRVHYVRIRSNSWQSCYGGSSLNVIRMMRQSLLT